ncbi:MULTISPECIES: hypothetical protein [Sphingobium]|uniref:hypothetical protein n=1 Tax=Sphingobium TaxID=165695 RepID=UPI0015EC20B7|nr:MULTISPECIES: hypothetical protein [Sphingobium]MCW2361641.1 putative cupredoxin-like copper-binding protein [Sphingobium sp. B10D3B]MCW2401680.1 putative cupredoxin-like copper-binding protein [Sphingobium sp. B10D7B]MCW2408660.1 putative cupredoxin-like copper-binding protein [Sphingobium xanthum]
MKNRLVVPIAAAAVISIVCLALGVGAYLGAVSAARLTEFTLLRDAGVALPASDAMRAARDLAAQEDMARWALLMLATSMIGVAVTVAGTGAVVIQIGLTRKALDAAESANVTSKEIGEAQVRAYLALSDCTVVLEHGKVKVRFKMTNAGQSPANGIVNEVTISIHHRNGDWSWQTSKRTSPVDISANRTEGMICRSTAQIPADHAAHFLQPSAAIIRVQCRTYYSDVFGHPQESDWFFATKKELVGEKNTVKLGRIVPPSKPWFPVNALEISAVQASEGDATV